MRLTPRKGLEKLFFFFTACLLQGVVNLLYVCSMKSLKEIHNQSKALKEAIEGQASLFGSLSSLVDPNRDTLYESLPTAFHYSIIESVTDRIFFEPISNEQIGEWLGDWLSTGKLIQLETKDCYLKPESKYQEWQLLKLSDFECLRDLQPRFTCDEMADWLYQEEDYNSAREIARRKMHAMESIKAVKIKRGRSIGENEHMQATVNKSLIKYIETI